LPSPIYKIADDKKSVVVDSVGKDQDYEVFRNELADAKDTRHPGDEDNLASVGIIRSAGTGEQL
jgi:hypothetical protein